jgi:hypothetical protein
MLPEPHASEVRKLLREYVQLRIDVLREPQEQISFEAATRRGDDLQAQLWQQAEEVNAANPQLNIVLFVQSLNQAIDLQETRLRGTQPRPGSAVPAALRHRGSGGRLQWLRCWF